MGYLSCPFALKVLCSDHNAECLESVPYADGGDSAATKWYAAGIGEVDDPLGTAVTSHFHGDMIGSMRMMTDEVSGAPVAEAVYTAFGELRPGSSNERHGYAGAWGYQTDVRPGSTPPASDMPFMHVGHRYYDPAIGRFLQRDPIGIRGGLNVYTYAENHPTATVDPLGLYTLGEVAEDVMDIAGMIVGVGSAVTLGAGGVAVPGGNIALVGGVVWGSGSWINFLSRHPMPEGTSPPPRGECTRGCHMEGWPRDGGRIRPFVPDPALRRRRPRQPPVSSACGGLTPML